MKAIIQRRRQRGDALGSLVVVVALAVLGYFAYKYFVSLEQPKLDCKAQFNRCQVECRKTASENTQMQSCLQECQQKAATCKD